MPDAKPEERVCVPRGHWYTYLGIQSRVVETTIHGDIMEYRKAPKRARKRHDRRKVAPPGESGLE